MASRQAVRSCSKWLSISVLEGVLELVERLVLGVEERPIAGEEVVVYHFSKRHLIPPGCHVAVARA